MAGTLVKRHREEEEEEEEKSDIQESHQEAKRYKSYNTTTTTTKQQQALVSFLEQQEEDDILVSSQDLSLFLTNLQQELFSDPLPCLPDPSQPDSSHGALQTLLLDPTTEDWNITCSKEDDEKESVIIRHLLEASDDELGLPNEVSVDRTVSSGDEDFNGADDDDEDKHNSSLFCDGLWELEDEAANYYTLLQSQLFM
ncbi:Zinc finger CCHC domain protein [Heracleum sosnowskyi]|uniref:Zinc finger CCHC domain protein n=1 Tax=Heracleum sosnowskyi TaxID=360622 RepID=A0AAD8MKA3_9APIA|nr:Zinc finger CCHC domain protein [Heracleum sosnowskyi]